MFFLIPSWDPEDSQSNPDHLEYNGMINLAKTLTSSNINSAQLVSINYLPFVHYMLHNYELYEMNVDCLFDMLQQVDQVKGFPKSISNLKWSNELDVIYGPYHIILRKDDSPYADVMISDSGFVSKIVYYNDYEKKSSVEYYDDRGFLSKRVCLSDRNKNTKSLYYNGHEQCVLIQQRDGSVSVSEKFLSYFDKKKYDCLEAVENEKLTSYLRSEYSDDDKIILSPNKQVAKVLSSLNIDAVVLISERSDLDCLRLVEDISCIKAIVFSNVSLQKEYLSRDYFEPFWDIPLYRIPVYPTDLLLGISDQEKYFNLYWNIDDMEYQEVFKVEQLLLNLIVSNDDCSVVINNAGNTLDTRVLQKVINSQVEERFDIVVNSEDFQFVAEYYKSKETKQLYIAQEKKKKELVKRGMWEKNEKAYLFKKRIVLFDKLSKKDIKIKMSRARILLDLNTELDNYLQMLAISVGIPQINKEYNEFIVNGKNGFKVSDYLGSELVEKIMYFLKNLNNWNISVVENATLIEVYSAASLIQKWKQVFI